jgi:hypothetical protein
LVQTFEWPNDLQRQDVHSSSAVQAARKATVPAQAPASIMGAVSGGCLPSSLQDENSAVANKIRITTMRGPTAPMVLESGDAGDDLVLTRDPACI